MPAYNFGMLTAGLPDLAQRQVSNPIQGEDYYQGQQNDWLKAWQPKWDAATPRYVQTSAGGWSGGDASALQAAINGKTNSAAGVGWTADADGSYAQSLISQAQGGDASAQNLVGMFGGSYGTYTAPTGYTDNSARLALEAERARQNAQFAAATQGRVQNQQAQQSAYNQSNGGGFSGGIINASYGTPFGGDSTMSGMMNNGIAMPNDQPWGSPAYGGPQGGESQAGFGGGAGMMNAQPQGWGGPFTAKNPWSLS